MGSLLTTSLARISWRVALWTSTIGVSPVTVIVSATEPTFRSALMVITPAPVTSTFSRLTVLKPVSVNVTAYAPGGSSVKRYCPVPSVTALLDFSSSTGLDTSTVTPGSTAPDESFTTPASVACAKAEAGTAASQRKSQTTLFTADIDPPTLRFRDYGVRRASPIGER